MIEIKELETLKVNFIGTIYELAKPNRKSFKEMQTKISAAKGNELDVICEVLVGTGLPQEVADQLQVEHISQIFEALVGAQKKK